MLHFSGRAVHSSVPRRNGENEESNKRAQNKVGRNLSMKVNAKLITGNKINTVEAGSTLMLLTDV